MNKLNGKLRVTEVDSFSDALVRLYKADEGIAGDAFLKGVMAEIENFSASITTAIKQDKVKSTLDDADTVRDEAVRSLGALLDGYTAIPVASKKAAAETLRAIFGKYGRDITGENYAAESSLIESLLEDFGTADAKKAAAELDGVELLLTQIRAAEDAFKTASDEYTAATSVKIDSASSLKKPLAAAVNDRLVPYITAMVMADSATYGTFATKLEKEIDRVNAIVLRRGASASSTGSLTGQEM